MYHVWKCIAMLRYIVKLYRRKRNTFNHDGSGLYTYDFFLIFRGKSDTLSYLENIFYLLDDWFLNAFQLSLKVLPIQTAEEYRITKTF